MTDINPISLLIRDKEGNLSTIIGEVLLIALLSTAAQSSKASMGIKRDADLIKNELNLEGASLTEANRNKIKAAWLGYLAIRSYEQLDYESSLDVEVLCAQENIDHFQPSEGLMILFDRLISSSSFVNNKINGTSNIEREEISQKSFFSKCGLPMGKLSKQKRLIIFLCVIWIIFSSMRLTDNFYLFGIRLSQWQDDNAFLTIFGPVVLALLTIKIVNWINKGR